MEVPRAPATFYRNKQAVRCSAGKSIPRDSDVIIETNKLPGQQPFGDGMETGLVL